MLPWCVGIFNQPRKLKQKKFLLASSIEWMQFMKKFLLMINSQIFAMKIPWSWLAMKAHFSKKYIGIFVLIFILFLPNGKPESLTDSSPPTLNETFFRTLVPVCPKLLPTVFQDRAPQGVIGETVFLNKVNDISTLNGCVEECCRNSTCKTVFAYKNSPDFVCYLVSLNKLKGKAFLTRID